MSEDKNSPATIINEGEIIIKSCSNVIFRDILFERKDDGNAKSLFIVSNSSVLFSNCGFINNNILSLICLASLQSNVHFNKDCKLLGSGTWQELYLNKGLIQADVGSNFTFDKVRTWEELDKVFSFKGAIYTPYNIEEFNTKSILFTDNNKKYITMGKINLEREGYSDFESIKKWVTENFEPKKLTE